MPPLRVRKWTFRPSKNGHWDKKKSKARWKKMKSASTAAHRAHIKSKALALARFRRPAGSGFRPPRTISPETLKRFLAQGEQKPSLVSRPRAFKRSNLVRKAFMELLDGLNHVYFMRGSKPLRVNETPVYARWLGRWDSFLAKPGVREELRQLARQYEHVLGSRHLLKYAVVLHRIGLAMKEKKE